MARVISCSATTEQVIARTKTQTRRRGWWTDKNGRRLVLPGDQLQIVDKAMGLKKGQRPNRLALVEVGASCEPGKTAAATIIDWTLPTPLIGERAKPLAPKTRERIAAGLARHGWAPITTTALATPPNFLFQTAHGGRVHETTEPHPTVCASDDRLSLVVGLRGTEAGQVAGSAYPSTDPLRTVSAGGIHHGLLVANNANNQPFPTAEPIGTMTTGNRWGLLTRHQSTRPGDNGGHLTTSTDGPTGTMVASAVSTSLVMPYRAGSSMRPVADPLHTQTTIDSSALVVPDWVIDECGFRMLESYEVAAAMAFPKGYIPRKLSKRDQVKLAGNAVTPPVMTWLIGRVVESMAS